VPEQVVKRGVVFLSEKIPARISSVFSRYPADLTLILFWLAACVIAMYVPLLNTTPVRIILALPLVLFIPGYSVVAALYPKDHDIELIERIALSFGLSIVVVPLIGYGLHFTPLGIRLDSLVTILCFFIVVMISIAHYRRTRVPLPERFSVPFSDIAAAGKKELYPSTTSSFDRLLGIILCLGILAAAGTTIVVFSFPKGGENYTEFYLLDENRTTAHYPNLTFIGMEYPMYVGVGNHESRAITYTIETWMMRTEFNNVTNTTSIITMDPKDRLTITLAEDEKKIIPYNLSVNKNDYTRVDFLLFNESVPDFDVMGSDRINASYRDLHIWVIEPPPEEEDDEEEE
jgi:uncharacterized membrane protein